MKTWWPFFLAVAIAGTLVALYLLGWYRSAWVLAIFLICFPVLYVVFAISWLELEKHRVGKGVNTARSSSPSAEQAPDAGAVPPADPLGLACPHCGLQAVSVWRKWGLVAYGWDKPVACRACGHLVEVRGFYVMAWAFPFIFFCMLASLLMAAGWKQYGLALMLAGSLLAIGLGGMVFGVNLRKRGWTDPEVVQRACAAHER